MAVYTSKALIFKALRDAQFLVQCNQIGCIFSRVAVQSGEIAKSAVLAPDYAPNYTHFWADRSLESVLVYPIQYLNYLNIV